MLRLLLMIISYGALLILLIYPTIEAILSAAAMFFLGSCLLIYKKSYTVTFQKNSTAFLIPITIMLCANWGFIFYNRWLPSSKMQAIASIFHLTIEALLLIGAITLSLLSVYFIYAGLQAIINKLNETNPKNDYEKTLIYCIITAAVTVISAQMMIDIPVLSMGFLKFLWGILIVATAILFINCLSGKIMPAVFLGSGIFMVISTVNVYVYRFRGRLFEPVDVFSAGTAMNVAENYNLFPIPSKVLICWGIFATMLIAIYFIQQKDKQSLSLKSRFALLAACIISSSAIFICASHLKTYHWQKEGVSFNGYILDFVAKFKEISAAEPDNYSNELIASFENQYSTYDIIYKSSVAPPPAYFYCNG